MVIELYLMVILETFIEMTLETKLLRGILDDKSFSVQLETVTLELLINKCEENKIADDNPLWWNLYEIRDDFYKKTIGLVLYLQPLTMFLIMN